MTVEEAEALEHGIYRIFWKEGGISLAAVGTDADGKKWYAPTNWVTVPSTDWFAIERVELLVMRMPPLTSEQIEAVRRIVWPHRSET